MQIVTVFIQKSMIRKKIEMACMQEKISRRIKIIMIETAYAYKLILRRKIMMTRLQLIIRLIKISLFVT